MSVENFNFSCVLFLYTNENCIVCKKVNEGSLLNRTEAKKKEFLKWKKSYTCLFSMCRTKNVNS
jgi:hypothetical protein